MHALPLPPNDDGSSSVKQVCLYTATVRHRLLTFCCRFFKKKRHENVRFGLGEKQAHSSRRSRAGEGCAPLRASIKISWPLCPSFPPECYFFSFLIFISFFSVSLRAGFVDNSLTIVVNAMNRRETDRQPFDRLLTAETISLNGGQDTNPSRTFFLFCHISTTRLEGASTSLT